MTLQNQKFHDPKPEKPELETSKSQESTFIQQINAYIADQNLIPAGTRIIVGLSGGPDSLFLLYFLTGLRKEKSLELIAAHLDHEWRDNSGQDVLFCKQVCEQLSITFVSAKLSELNSFTQKPLFTAKQNGSKEEYARKARRASPQKRTRLPPPPRRR